MRRRPTCCWSSTAMATCGLSTTASCARAPKTLPRCRSYAPTTSSRAPPRRPVPSRATCRSAATGRRSASPSATRARTLAPPPRSAPSGSSATRSTRTRRCTTRSPAARTSASPRARTAAASTRRSSRRSPSAPEHASLRRDRLALRGLRPPRRRLRRRLGRDVDRLRRGPRLLAIAIRQRQPHDLLHDAAELLVQRSAVVRQPIALADLAHLDRQLAVAMRRDVREQVVLDLVAEVAAHDVEELAAGEVCRAEQLAHVPLPARLALALLLGELVRPLGEVAAEDDHERPHVAHGVGSHVPRERRRCARAGEQREQRVVLQRLPAALLPDRLQHLALVAPLRLAGIELLDLEVVQRDAPLEEQRQQHRIGRVTQVVRMPLLVLGHPQHAVADVAVLAENVRVRVMHVVVRVTPLLRRAR